MGIGFVHSYIDTTTTVVTDGCYISGDTPATLLLLVFPGPLYLTGKSENPLDGVKLKPGAFVKTSVERKRVDC